jgi:hypothetical protein
MQENFLSLTPDQYIRQELIPLISLLENVEKKSAIWQSETGRLVALAHLRSMSQDISDIEYLISLSLCRWAQVVGVVDAKKKNITPQKFRTQAAPSINNISNFHLFYFALELLTSLKADWCLKYISETTQSPQLEKKSIDLIAKWICKNSSTNSDFIKYLLIPTFEGITNSHIKNLITAQSLTLCKSMAWESPQRASKDFFESAISISILIVSNKHEKKTEAALCALLLGIQKRICEIQPFAILEGDFLVALQKVFENINAPKFKKITQAMQLQLSELTGACVLGLVQRGGSQEIQSLKPLLPILENLYKNFNKRLEDLSRIEPLLKDLYLKTENSSLQVTEDGAASVYSRLLPDWHTFITTQYESSEVSVLNSMLLQAASLNGIEWLGSTGETCMFDPKLHQVINGDAPIGKQIKIIRPAIIYKRGSQSYRIVLRGIVDLV